MVNDESTSSSRKLRQILRSVSSRRLMYGPYVNPDVEIGDALFCHVHGLQLVAGWSGPRQWPRAKAGGWPRLIVCGDLLRALELETCETVSVHWGIHLRTVVGWRKRLGIDGMPTKAATLYRSAKMRLEIDSNPHIFGLPGQARLSAMSSEARVELGRRTAGTRAWTQTDIDWLSKCDNATAASLSGRSLGAIRNARIRFKVPHPAKYYRCPTCKYRWQSYLSGQPTLCPNRECRVRLT